MTNSRDKGKRGEREAAGYLAECFGRPWRRSASQSQGAAVRGWQEPDLVLVDPDEGEEREGPEVKHCASVQVWAWWRQTTEDAGRAHRTPWLVWRRVAAGSRGSRQDWYLMAEPQDLPRVVELVCGCDIECGPPQWLAEREVGGRSPRWAAKLQAMPGPRPWVVVRRDGMSPVVICRLRDVVRVCEELTGAVMVTRPDEEE